MNSNYNQPHWWQSAVFYQIYPSSFAQGAGGDAGDLIGILNRLDYLEWLGVDCLWLSPIYPSPMADGGYDVANYTDIDPLYGNLEDFDRLLSAAHERNIKVILDWVPNHTSDQHPWFLESRSSRHNPKRDWYIWRDEPNNWTSDIKSGSAWEFDPPSNQYYLHSYLPSQPDLNWSNPSVREAMFGVLRFWLDRGVDGFRADVINMIAKDLDFDDIPDELINADRSHYQNIPAVHSYLKAIRRVLEEYTRDPVLIGELWLNDMVAAADYYGQDDELHAFFNLKLYQADWRADSWQAVIQALAEVAQSHGRWPSPVLGSHDLPRLRSRYGSLAHARAAAVLLLTLPGAPFMYAGDEFGLSDAEITAPIDPGGRDGSRAPLPWDDTPNHGWSQRPKLPFPPEVKATNYLSLRRNPNSILNFYRTLLHFRRSNSALNSDELKLIDGPENVLAYSRGTAEQRLLILVNFSPERIEMHLAGEFMVKVASDGIDDGTSIDKPFGQHLNPLQAVILQPINKNG